jgi:hypothetical protein
MRRPSMDGGRPVKTDEDGCGVNRQNIGSNYTSEDLEFMRAMEEYKRRKHRKFPTVTDALEVARSLGYRKLTPEQARQYDKDQLTRDYVI